MSIQRAIRHRCEIVGRLELSGEAHSVKVLDISLTGAFLATQLDLQFGDAGRLLLPLPGNDELWSADVRITRLGASQLAIRHPRVENVTVSRPGAGVIFDGLPEEEQRQLRGYLELLDEQ